jgi:hypothetical protein
MGNRIIGVAEFSDYVLLFQTAQANKDKLLLTTIK